jgi:two-component system OmpR family response regulator
MNLRKILLVDDEPALRTLTALCLRNLGKWQVVAAESGAEALARFEAERPDAVLLDVMMPELDGRQTLLRLRELPGGRAVPIIFMTALLEKEEHEQLLALGARGVIVKPFAPATLPALIRKLVE